jgi:hypothetical protein
VDLVGAAPLILEQAVKVPTYDCRDCGGSSAGECEIACRKCIWARADGRLAPYRESGLMLQRPVVVCDNAVRRTSAWTNTFLGRDHATRPPINPAADDAAASAAPGGAPERRP